MEGNKMGDMQDADEFAEAGTTEAEFDAMWAEGEPVAVVSGDRAVHTTYGTLHVLHNAGVVVQLPVGQAATLTSKTAEPARAL